MDIRDFDYDLPDILIAQTPLADRTASRLLTLNKHTGERAHRSFSDLIDFLEPGDLLIGNNSKVIPARLIGVKRDTNAHVEILLLREVNSHCWEALVRPAKRLKVGAKIDFGDQDHSIEPLLTATVIDEHDKGLRKLQFTCKGVFRDVLEQLGQMPLPPYITERLTDRDRYQTVFAQHEGSVAAPTAGLHFNQAYLERLAGKGIQIAHVTLHVGIGTFRPVDVEEVEEHVMHAEYYEVSQDVVELIQLTRNAGKRVIAIGTTAARTLETIASQCIAELPPSPQSHLETIPLKPYSGWTNIFIYPGYRFRLVDALITNFHLPKSTLLMMVSALAGREHIFAAYHEAVQERYRFFSFGDAMFIY